MLKVENQKTHIAEKIKLILNLKSQEKHFLSSGISHPGWYFSPHFTATIYPKNAQFNLLYRLLVT